MYMVIIIVGIYCTSNNRDNNSAPPFAIHRIMLRLR